MKQQDIGPFGLDASQQVALPDPELGADLVEAVRAVQESEQALPFRAIVLFVVVIIVIVMGGGIGRCCGCAVSGWSTTIPGNPGDAGGGGPRFASAPMVVMMVVVVVMGGF